MQEEILLVQSFGVGGPIPSSIKFLYTLVLSLEVWRVRNKPNEPTSSFIRAKLLKIDLWVISLAFAKYRFFFMTRPCQQIFTGAVKFRNSNHQEPKDQDKKILVGDETSSNLSLQSEFF